MTERTDNQRIGDISYQIALLVHEIRALREYMVANGEYLVSGDEFNKNIAKKLTDEKETNR